AFSAPEDVLRSITAPSEVSGVPAEEILLPICEEVWVVNGTPPSCDRVPFEVNVDSGLLRLCEQLGMSNQGVCVRPKNRLIGRKLPRCRVIVEELVRPGDEIFPVRGIGEARVVLPPCELAIEKPSIHRRHLRAAIVLIHSQVFRTQ